MGKFVLVYRGGAAPTTEAEGAEVMEAWTSWLGGLGTAVVDGGNPFGASTALTPTGAAAASAGLSGYSILSADGLTAAAALAQGCPILAAGGSVEVYEAHDM